MNKNINLTEKEIQEKIRKVDGAMAQEGMPLTKEIKKKLYDCITGKSTYEKERQKIRKQQEKSTIEYIVPRTGVNRQRARES